MEPLRFGCKMESQYVRRYLCRDALSPPAVLCTPSPFLLFRYHFPPPLIAAAHAPTHTISRTRTAPPHSTTAQHYRTALPCRVDVRRPRGALRPPDTRRLLRAPATLCEALAGRVGRRPSSMNPSALEWALLPPRFAAISRFDRARDGETLRIGDVAPSLPSSRSRRLRWMRTGDHSCGGGSRSVSVRTRSACASARCCATATSAAPRLASRAVWAHVAQSARRIRSVSVTIARTLPVGMVSWTTLRKQAGVIVRGYCEMSATVPATQSSTHITSALDATRSTMTSHTRALGKTGKCRWVAIKSPTSPSNASQASSIGFDSKPPTSSTLPQVAHSHEWQPRLYQVSSRHDTYPNKPTMCFLSSRTTAWRT